MSNLARQLTQSHDMSAKVAQAWCWNPSGRDRWGDEPMRIVIENPARDVSEDEIRKDLSPCRCGTSRSGTRNRLRRPRFRPYDIRVASMERPSLLERGLKRRMRCPSSWRTGAINGIAANGRSGALIRYEDGIVRALEDVENALVALQDERRRAKSLQTAAAAAEAALGRAQSLYERGQIDLLPLLDAQRARLAVRVSANDSNPQSLLDSVQLYKALGGGWKVFEPVAEPLAAGAGHAPNSRNYVHRHEDPS